MFQLKLIWLTTCIEICIVIHNALPQLWNYGVNPASSFTNYCQNKAESSSFNTRCQNYDIDASSLFNTRCQNYEYDIDASSLFNTRCRNCSLAESPFSTTMGQRLRLHHVSVVNDFADKRFSRISSRKRKISQNRFSPFTWGTKRVNNLVTVSL